MDNFLSEKQTVAIPTRACTAHANTIIDYNKVGLYSIVTECENQLDDDSVILVDKYKQSLSLFSTSIVHALIEKLKPISMRYKLDFENILYSAMWVMGRIRKVEDYTDVFSILDYISRIHMSKPAGAAIMDFLFSQQSEAQSMDWASLRGVFTSYESLKTHPAIIKFTKLISVAFSGGLFASLGVQCEMANMWKVVTEGMTKIAGHTDFIAALIDLALYIAERVSAFLITGDWRSLFYTPTHFKKWADDASGILEKSSCVSNLSALGIDYHEYLSDLDTCIKTGQEIQKYLKAGEAKDSVSALLSRLRMFQNEILVKQACGKTREVPFSILVAGGSGVAKSSFIQMCVSHYAHSYGKKLGDDHIYTRTAKEEHWNSYKSSKWCTILDDIASVNPSKGTSDPSLDEILQIVNNTPMMTNQAALEDKGKVPFLSEFVVATTNTENLKAHIWFNNPQAIRRRFAYIINLLPKPEFRLQGSNMLDKGKAACAATEDYPNFWEITVKTTHVDQNEELIIKELHKFNDVYDFCVWFNTAVDQHKNEQKSYIASTERSRKVDFCMIHRLPRSKCCCVSDEASRPQGAMFGTILGATATFGALQFTQESVNRALNMQPNLQGQPQALLAAAASVSQDRILQVAEYYHPVNICKRKLQEAARMAYEHIMEYINPKMKLILGALAGVAALGLTWKWLRHEVPDFGHNEVQNVDGVGIIPKGKDEIENVWRKDDYVPSEFIDRLSESWASLPLAKVASLVGKNTVWCSTTHGEDARYHSRFRALCVGGHLYVTTSHCMPITDEYFTLQVIHEKPTEGCNGNVSFKVSQKMLYRPENTELVFFEIKHMPVRRDIRGIFPKFGVKFKAPGVMVVRNPDGSLEYNHSSCTKVLYDHYIEAFNMKMHIGASTFTRETLNGECGSPVLVHMPNGIILGGVHVLGGNGLTAASVMIFQEQIETAVDYYATPIVSALKPDLDKVDFSTDISPKCTVRFIQSGTVEVYGSFSGFKRQPKSTGIPTCLSPILKAKGWENNYGPAPMKGYRPLRLAILPMVQKQCIFEEDVLTECMFSFVNDVLIELPNEDLLELKSYYSLEVALNGVPGLRYVDSMNFGTSSGFPYNKSKTHYITRLPSDEVWQHPVTIDVEIRQDVDRIWKRMTSGSRSGIVFMQHIKDEILPLSKVVAGKSRIFMGGPFGWSICVRMALLPFIRVMQRNKYLFEGAPGTNATSIEWTRLYQYLSAYGEDRAIAGDFKAFDKAMGSLVILLAFRFIQRILRHAGATEEHILVVQSIAEDVAFAYCNYNGDFMQFYGSNPSGHPLTVIINCIVNSLYMRYCYAQASPLRSAKNFRNDVRLMTYGDDNVMTSRVDWFNHTVIADKLAAVGITYTMADKVSESIPFLPLSQVSFLKRTFVWNEELRAHMAVLDEDSIKKSMLMCIPSKTESHQKQCADIVRSAVSEYFFYGKAKFNEMSQFLRIVISEANLEPYIEDGTFPKWEEMVERFVKSSIDYLKFEPESTVKILGKSDWDLNPK